MNHIKFAQQQKDAPYRIFVPKSKTVREVHFSIRGPKGCPFEGGLYHGVLKLSNEYPHVAPEIQFLQNSGKFKTDGPICLSYKENPSLWSASLGLNGAIRSVQSLFCDETIAGVNIIQHPVKEEVEKYRDASKTYRCEVCGCNHADFYDQIQSVEDEFDHSVIVPDNVGAK